MSAGLPSLLYRDLLLYTGYRFLKWKMIRGNEFMAISCFIFVPQKFDGRIYKNFSVFLDELFE